MTKEITGVVTVIDKKEVVGNREVCTTESHNNQSRGASTLIYLGRI